ncbi:MAG: hypothetical protein HY670_07400 [Chloroflexi bacterium]|nr:hypothetical protein [Chloroflexota bacterium]
MDPEIDEHLGCPDANGHGVKNGYTDLGFDLLRRDDERNEDGTEGHDDLGVFFLDSFAEQLDRKVFISSFLFQDSCTGIFQGTMDVTKLLMFQRRSRRWAKDLAESSIIRIQIRSPRSAAVYRATGSISTTGMLTRWRAMEAPTSDSPVVLTAS